MKYMIIPIILLCFACSQPAIVPEQTVQEPVQEPIPTCFDGLLNQDEVQIDCGGSCKACPSCDDGLLNQGEEDIDCGGPCKQACPTCYDKVKNQAEVEVDCGGPCKPCQIDYEIKADDAIALKDKLKPNIEATFLSSSYPTGLLIGESHVFPLGITNTMTLPYDFDIELNFKEARNSKGNRIEDTDSATILEWFKDNEWKTYHLDKYDQVLVPVGVTVGEFMADGMETQKGIYYFLLNVNYQKTKYTVEEHKELEFSFKVI